MNDSTWWSMVSAMRWKISRGSLMLWLYFPWRPTGCSYRATARIGNRNKLGRNRVLEESMRGKSDGVAVGGKHTGSSPRLKKVRSLVDVPKNHCHTLACFDPLFTGFVELYQKCGPKPQCILLICDSPGGH